MVHCSIRMIVLRRLEHSESLGLPTAQPEGALAKTHTIAVSSEGLKPEGGAAPSGPLVACGAHAEQPIGTAWFHKPSSISCARITPTANCSSSMTVTMP